VILLFSILTLLPFVPQSLINRIGTIGNSISQADMGGRVTMWRKSIVVLAQHPILGVGSGTIDRTIGGAVHNTLISVATETGFIGLVLFLSILGLVAYDVFRLPKGSSGLWLAIFTTWAIGALSLSWEFRKLTWIILNFIIIGSRLGNEVGEPLANVGSPADIRQSLRRDELISQPAISGDR
jgi:O-antigen ligase